MQHNLWKLVALCGVVGVGVLVVVQTHRALQPQSPAADEAIVQNAEQAGTQLPEDGSEPTAESEPLDPRSPLLGLADRTTDEAGTAPVAASDPGAMAAAPPLEPPPGQFEPRPDARPLSESSPTAAGLHHPFEDGGRPAEPDDSVSSADPRRNRNVDDRSVRAAEGSGEIDPAFATMPAGPSRDVPAASGPDPFSPSAGTDSDGGLPIAAATETEDVRRATAAADGPGAGQLPALEPALGDATPPSDKRGEAERRGAVVTESTRAIPPLPLPTRSAGSAKTEGTEGGGGTSVGPADSEDGALETASGGRSALPPLDLPQPADDPFAVQEQPARGPTAGAREGAAPVEAIPRDVAGPNPPVAGAPSDVQERIVRDDAAGRLRELPHDFGSAAPAFATDGAKGNGAGDSGSSVSSIPKAPPLEDTPFDGELTDPPPLRVPTVASSEQRDAAGAEARGVRTADADASDANGGPALQLVGGESPGEAALPTFDVGPQRDPARASERSSAGDALRLDLDTPRRLPATDAAPLTGSRKASDFAGNPPRRRPAAASFDERATAGETAVERTVATSPPVAGAASAESGDATASKLPQLKLEKVAPEKAVLGQPMIYSIIVRNVGTVAARQVVVEDEIPRGTKLEGTIPRAELAGNKLIWRLGTLEPEEQKKILVKVIPVQEGQIGSVATVSFVAEVATRTVVNAPKLKLVVEGPRSARVGQDVELQFRVSNEGTAPATGVFLRNLVPAELTHPGGKDLEYEVGELQPGASQTVTLTLKAVRPGEAVNRTMVTADGGLSAEVTHRMAVSGLQVELTRLGPKKRLLGRPVTFINRLHNASDSGTGPLTVREILPQGVEFRSAEPRGRFEPRTRTVTWVLPDLPADASRDLTLTVVPRSAGRLPFVVTVQDDFGNQKRLETQLEALGVPAVGVAFDRIDAVVALGDTATVRLVVKNRGFGPDTNVALRVQLPPQVQFVAAKGPTAHQLEGRTVRFAPLPEIPAGGQQVFELTIKTQQPGNARLHAEIVSDRLARPVVVEETIAVFAEN